MILDLAVRLIKCRTKRCARTARYVQFISLDCRFTQERGWVGHRFRYGCDEERNPGPCKDWNTCTQ